MNRGFAQRLARVLAPLGVPLVLGVLQHYAIQGCPWFVLTGVDCPGCGVVRGCVALLDGDVAGSVRFNPFAPLVALLGVGWFGRHAWYAARGLSAPWIRVPAVVAGALSVGLVGVWGVRLAGGLGGLPDPIDPAHGWIGLGVAWIGKTLVP